MKRECDVCGLEAEEYWMIAYNTGRGMKWFCWDCWKNSQREAAASEMARQQRLHRINESKQRNK